MNGRAAVGGCADSGKSEFNQWSELDASAPHLAGKREGEERLPGKNKQVFIEKPNGLLEQMEDKKVCDDVC